MPPHLASAPNINHLWAALLVEELVRQGTTFFVVCPGSRSTPLAVAVAQNPRAEALVHWDERAAGFVALGWGRARGWPAAVVTTSGTAVANLLPAAVEADAENVPLLLLTADRPPELRETGANQTIRQPPIFQDVARWTLDWPVPTPDVSPRWVLSTASHAVHRAASGLVHLNLPFREPLGVQPDGVDVADALSDLARWGASDDPSLHTERLKRFTADVEPNEVDLSVLMELGVERGLVVVGDLKGREQAAPGAVRLASTLGWPLLPDVRSGLRTAEGSHIVHFADLALSASLPMDYWPEAVIHLGGRIVSKRIGQFLAAARPATYVRVDDSPYRVDPDALVTQHIVASVRHGTAALAGASTYQRPGAEKDAFLQRWQTLSIVVGDAVATGIEGAFSEPSVARMTLGAALEGYHQDRTLVAAASMPVRDIEMYAEPSGTISHVEANRGASGIDGTIATAHGVARGLQAPVVALVGDLALLHDQTSLALLRGGPPVVVVVINNDGGGIFHRLPIASGPGALAGDTFERFFGTPHGLTFEHAAAQAGLAYHQPDSIEAFEQALDTATASGASALIEVRTDRDEQAALRRRIEAAVAEAVDAALA
ncbi:MAG: 2-succinyl-5-enolpyruvyl-6-hydroxy-3-cyclohexene-1-carboxylic-acid synthase [Bacteroidota bacterium]